jgi:hypothetical protein
MTEGDRVLFTTLIDGVYHFYGKSKDLSEFGLNVWWNALKQYDLRALENALGRHCVDPDQGKFLPRPADVVRLLEGSTLDSAQLAWTKVIEGVRHVGTYESVCFDDPIINRVVEDMGGWIGLGAIKTEELPFRAKEFEQRYRAYKVAGGARIWPPYLAGIIERDNSAKGYRESAGPRLIGDPARAKLVLEQGQRVLNAPVRAAALLPTAGST